MSAHEVLPFGGYLTDEQIKTVDESAASRYVAKGEILYGCGTTCLGMAHVVSGKLRVYITSAEGREITLYTLSPGDDCVLSASCVISRISFDTVITAERDSELLVLNSGVFSKLADENIYVKEFMYELATDRFSRVMRVMQEILFFSFDRRLARFLAGEYERTGDPEIKMTQEEIASKVNSAREVVARMLRRFSDEGLTEIRHGSVLIKDIDRLRKLV